MRTKNSRKLNKGYFMLLFWLSITFLGLIGECQCIYKAISSDWNPINEREIIYTVGAISGTGAIIGWFDIPDKKFY